ncbi:MAG: polyribonucleotide nucleotidyltransferase [candidate division SR1 bacterium]|nr:polyribonucleotide nucleotidyltransferase [candidate division SR1 bacterium]
MAITAKKFDVHAKTFDREGKKISFETGKLAVQATNATKIQFGENVFLVATVMEANPRPDSDFLPLMIDVRESFSAAGRLGGAAYRRREGRASDQAVLYCRLTDRALRPMFPKGMINDVVITITPLAMDQEFDSGVSMLIASSLSLMSAGIPFDGPVGAAQIGYIDEKFIINPTIAELEKSMFNLIVAGKKGTINMIEADGAEVPAELMKKACEVGQKAIDQSCDFQTAFLKELTITKKEIKYNKPSEDLMSFISNILTKDKLNAMTGNTKVPFNDLYVQYEKEALELSKENIADKEQEEFTEAKIKMAVFNTIKKFIRTRTLETGKRLDDRDQKDIRPLYCEVNVLPRVHGAGLFRRGDTQVLSTVTLGGPKEFLILDDTEHYNVHQRYIHHYNFPPFSTGEAKAMRGTGRREIGHGRLAEKALERMLPSMEEFPYTIRVVSECLGSGGSTSMGSVCGSTLALYDAGVKLIKPVAGIAMGLMTEHDDDSDVIKKHIVLNDLMGTEDFTGDMDFKVAGTKDGITAIQLDTKLKGLTMDIVHETIDRACEGYKEIMDFMLKTIDKPNATLREHAPKIQIIHIKPDKVREVIGKGGDVINGIIDSNPGVKIDFEDDGTCYIGHKDQAVIDKVIAIVLEIASDLEPGQEFDAKIKRIEDYGLFVELPKKKMGLCHISNLGQRYETPLTNSFKLGQVIRVKIKGIDADGKVACMKI